MHYVEVFVLLLVFVFGLGLAARRIGIPYPILFVLGGLLIGFLPNLPKLTLDPDFIFFLFLPPLLYVQAFYTSWRDFRREMGAIVSLSVGLVAFTTVAVAYLAHWMMPDFPPGNGPFPLAAGFVLGAIISPPDAIAAAAIAQKLGLPRRIVTILEGESLVNDATSLVIFQMALVAILNPGAHVFGEVWHAGAFLYVAFGGICVGLAVGWVVIQIMRRVIDDGPEIVLTLSLLTPFISYLSGQLVHASSVLAVVSTGLYVGRHQPAILPSIIRLRVRSVWEAIVYLLNGFVFVLIGLQLPGILVHMREHWWPRPFLYAVAITTACIFIRLLWVFPAAYLPRLIPAVRKALPRPGAKETFIIGWAGMRGVVSLAAALALNGYPEFPRGHLTQFIAFGVILGTLVFQGLTLPPLIRWFGLADDGSGEREEAEARRRIVDAVLAKIDESRRAEEYAPAILDEVEHHYREHFYVPPDEEDDAHPDSHGHHHHHFHSIRRLQQTMVTTGQLTLLALRRDGTIGDEVLHKIERELDLEDARLRL